MSNTKILDVRGLSCPQPALQTKQVIKNMDSGTIEVLVDSRASRDNVTRLVQKAGWDVTVEEKSEGTFRLVLSK